MSGKDQHEAHRKRDHEEHTSKEKSHHKASRDALQHEKGQHDRAVQHSRDLHKTTDKTNHSEKAKDHAEERKNKRLTEGLDPATNNKHKYDEHGRISGIEYSDGNSATIHYSGKHADKITVRITDKHKRTVVDQSTDSHHTVRVNQQSGAIEVISIEKHKSSGTEKSAIRYLPDGHVSISHYDRKNQLRVYELKDSYDQGSLLEKHIFEHHELRSTSKHETNTDKTSNDETSTVKTSKVQISGYETVKGETSNEKSQSVITETVIDSNNRITDRFTYSNNENLQKQRASTHERITYATTTDGTPGKETHEFFDLTKGLPAVKVSSLSIETNQKTGEKSHETLLANGDRQVVRVSKDGHPTAVTFTTSSSDKQLTFSLKDGLAVDVKNSKGTISDTERTKLLDSANLSIAEAKSFVKQADAPARSTSNPALDVSDLTGTLTASGQRGERYSIISGKIFDSSKQLLGSLDENGLVHFADSNKGSAQPLTSVFNNHFEFHGEQNGLPRQIICSDKNKLTDGKVFLPVNGISTQFDVRLGMLINSQTGEQLGRIAPPVVQHEQMTGGEITFKDGKTVALASITGAVFDLKVLDNSGRSMHESDIRGLSLGTDSEAGTKDTASSNQFLNIADAIKRETQLIEKSETDFTDAQNNVDNLSKARSVLNIVSPIGSFAANRLGLNDINRSAEDQVSAEKMSTSFHEKQLRDLQSLLTTGLQNSRQAENLGVRFGNTTDTHLIELSDNGVSRKDEAKDDRPKIQVPSLTEDNIDTIQGKLRLGDQVYSIKSGTLYETFTNNGKTVEVEAGQLHPNYQVSFKNGATISLADQYRVLLDMTVGKDLSHHQIVGLGPKRNTDSFGYNSGGLCDRKELYSQALDAQKAAGAVNTEYFNNRSYATGWIANAGAGDFETTMHQLEQRIEADTTHFKKQMDKLFTEGFDCNKVTNNQLDGHLDSAQLMLKNMGATASDTNDIALEGRQVQQLTNDSLVIAGTTVATAGIGAAPGLAATLAKGGTMVRVGVTAAEVASGSLAGGGISYVGRMSNSSDNVANFKAGMIEGASMSASSASFKLMGNTKMLGQARALANDIRTEKTTLSALSSEQQALMHSSIGKMALAGKGDAYVRTVSTAHVLTDSMMQSAAFGTAAKIRQHDAKPLTMQELAIGTGAMLIGHYSRAGIASGAGKIGVSEHSLANAALSDMASAYSNGCAGQAVLAQQHERERVAKLMKVSPDMVPSEALNYLNIFREVHDAGLISAMSAPFMTAGTRSIAALSRSASNPQLLMQRLSSAAESTNANSSEHLETAHGFQAAKDLIGQHEELTPEMLTGYAEQLRMQANAYSEKQQENVAAGYQHAANILAPDTRVFDGEHVTGEIQKPKPESPENSGESNDSARLDQIFATAQDDNPVLKEMQKIRSAAEASEASEATVAKLTASNKPIYSDAIPEPEDPPGVKFAGDKETLERLLTPESLLTARFAQELTEKMGPLNVIVNTEGNWHRVYLYAKDPQHLVGNAMITRKGATGDDAKTFLVEHFVLQNPLKKAGGDGKEGLRADEFEHMQTAVILAVMNMGGHAIESGGANNYRVSKLYKRSNFQPCNEEIKATYEQIERYRSFYNSKDMPSELKPERRKDAESTGFESTLGSMTHLSNTIEDRLAWDQYRRAQRTGAPEPANAKVINHKTKDGPTVSAFAYTRKNGTTHLSFLKGTSADPIQHRELFEWSHEEVAGNLRLRQEFKQTEE